MSKRKGNKQDSFFPGSADHDVLDKSNIINNRKVVKHFKRKEPQVSNVQLAEQVKDLQTTLQEISVDLDQLRSNTFDHLNGATSIITEHCNKLNSTVLFLLSCTTLFTFMATVLATFAFFK